jgi:hypothetical protein
MEGKCKEGKKGYVWDGVEWEDGKSGRDVYGTREVV